nr:retrovirus-related Pol polyprotein from transposon TNT 1-94 [Tanacetum cinerariifolium]
MVMLSVRVHKFEQKAGRKIDFDKKESARFNKKKVRCYKCQQRGHFTRECRAMGGNDKQIYSSFKIKKIGKKEEDSKDLITVDTFVDWTYHDGESDVVIASKEFGMIAGCDTEDAIQEGTVKIYNLITGSDTEEASTTGDAEEFALMGVTSKTKLDNHLVQTERWRISSKNLFRLIDSSMSVRTKVGLEFNNHIRENELGWDDSAFSVFTTNSEDVKGRPLFSSGTHLIKDCDFYEKQMVNKTVGIWVGPVHSRHKVNHQNQFVPQAALLRTGKVNIPPAKSQPVPTGKPKVFALVPTGRQNRPFPVPTDRGYSPSELQQFNLFSISQICDKKNRVLITDTECLVLSTDFTLPDERGNLACLVANASVDESVKWHRRMGHVNYKNMNRLVKGNLVRGLPPKLFKHDHTCVACCKGDEGYFVGYSLSSKAFKLFNKRTKKVEENLHVDFLENKLIEKGAGPNWLFDIDTLTNSMNYVPVVVAGTSSTNISSVPESSGISNPTATSKVPSADQLEPTVSLIVEYDILTVSLPVPTVCLDNSPESSSGLRLISKRVFSHEDAPSLGNVLTFSNRFEDTFEDTTNAVTLNGVEVDLSNMETSIPEEGTDYEEVFAPVAMIESIKLFLAYASFMCSIVYHMDVKSAFLYGTIDEEVYVMQPPGFQDPEFQDKVYKVEKAMYGLHQAPRDWYDVRLANTPMDKENPWGKDRPDFLENKPIEKGAGPNWLFDIDSLTNSMNYVPVVVAGINSINFSSTKEAAGQDVKKDVSSLRYIVLPNWFHETHLESSTSNAHDACNADDPKSSGNSNPTATSTNLPVDHMETLAVETPIPTVSSPVPTACLNDSPELSSDIRLISKRVTSQDDTPSLDNILTLTNRFEDILGVTTNTDDTNGVEADLGNMETTITASPTPTFRIYKDHPKIYQMDVKSSFLYGTIDEKVYVMQPPEFQDLEFLTRVYKVEKAIYGLHQAPRAWYVYQMDVKSSFLYGTIDEKVYLKGHPKLGLWYPKESPFDLVAYSDSDYGGASQDCKSTTGGCQFLGRRLILWQCKKQIIVATSTTKEEYVAAASGCGQVLWI